MSETNEIDDMTARMTAGMPDNVAPLVAPDVAALLEAEGVQPEKPSSGVLKLDAETEAALRGETEEGKRIEIPPPAQWSPGSEPESQWNLWTKELGTLGEVEVTELDKKLFLKAVMYDTEVELDIELKGLPDFAFKIRSLSNGMLRALAMAMGKDGSEGIFNGDLSIWASRLQYYCVLLQFRGIGDTVKPLMPEVIDGQPASALSIEATCDWLRTNIDVALAPVSGPRYLAIVQAVRIFEVKLSRCKEGLANGDFFGTADTSS